MGTATAMKKIAADQNNRHRVAKSQWRKWSGQARDLFNSMYETMKKNQSLFHHPDQEHLPKKHWETVCWNAAWIAADTFDDKA
jgi:hypothetical protein